VEALALVRDRDGVTIPLVLSGSLEGDHRSKVFRELMDLAARLNMTQQLTYVGYVTDDEVRSLMRGAAALVVTELQEAPLLPVPEAWSVGCPVIASDLPGITEQVGPAGRLVNPRDRESIARAVLDLWTDASLADALRSAGRQRLAEYDAGAFRIRFAALLDEAIGLINTGRP
jgi:glycosyltransferase involved in cell wall biosynthesis